MSAITSAAARKADPPSRPPKRQASLDARMRMNPSSLFAVVGSDSDGASSCASSSSEYSGGSEEGGARGGRPPSSRASRWGGGVGKEKRSTVPAASVAATERSKEREEKKKKKRRASAPAKAKAGGARKKKATASEVSKRTRRTVGSIRVAADRTVVVSRATVRRRRSAFSQGTKDEMKGEKRSRFLGGDDSDADADAIEACSAGSTSSGSKIRRRRRETADAITTSTQPSRKKQRVVEATENNGETKGVIVMARKITNNTSCSGSETDFAKVGGSWETGTCRRSARVETQRNGSVPALATATATTSTSARSTASSGRGKKKEKSKTVTPSPHVLRRSKGDVVRPPIRGTLLQMQEFPVNIDSFPQCCVPCYQRQSSPTAAAPPSCGCNHYAHHCSAACTTEVYLCTYGREYHLSLRRREDEARRFLPGSRSARESEDMRSLSSSVGSSVLNTPQTASPSSVSLALASASSTTIASSTPGELKENRSRETASLSGSEDGGKGTVESRSPVLSSSSQLSDGSCDATDIDTSSEQPSSNGGSSMGSSSYSCSGLSSDLESDLGLGLDSNATTKLDESDYESDRVARTAPVKAKGGGSGEAADPEMEVCAFMGGSDNDKDSSQSKGPGGRGLSPFSTSHFMSSSVAVAPAGRETSLSSSRSPPSFDSSSSGPLHNNYDDPTILDYMSRQPQLNARMRLILIDWLVEVAEEYKVGEGTLFLGVALVDRALAAVTSPASCEEEEKGVALRRSGRKRRGLGSSQSMILGDTAGHLSEVPAMSVEREMLQCLGSSCLWIASKLEEIHPPTLEDFVYISDSSYSKKDIVTMESQVCSSLRYHLQHVTPYHFLHRYLRASDASSSSGHSGGPVVVGPPNERLAFMASYLLELGLLRYDLVSRKPSLVAASTVYLARATLGVRHRLNPPSTALLSFRQLREPPFWNETLRHYTGYDVPDLEATVRVLHSAQISMAGEEEFKSVYNKYKDSEHMRVSVKAAVLAEDLGF